MNDHIGKPFDLDDLVRVLRRLTGRGENPENPTQPSEASLSAQALGHAQAIGVELSQAIGRLGGRADVYRRMLQRFLKDLPQITEKIREAVEVQHWPQAAAQTHTLKGLAGTLGAPGWQEALRSAEKAFAGASMDADEARRLLDAIGERAAIIQAGAPALIAALAPGPAEPVADATLDPLQVRRALEDLLGLLRASDMSAVDHYEAMQAGLQAWPAEPVAALDEAMSALDFEDAIVRCEALLRQSPPGADTGTDEPSVPGRTP